MTSSSRRDRSDLYARVFPRLKDASAHDTRQVAPIFGQNVLSFCPAHADGAKHGRRSLILYADGGLHCFHGCNFKDIMDGLGVPRVHQAQTSEPPAIVSRKAYRLPHPTDRIEHVRVDFQDSTKQMWWERNGRPGLQGLKVEDLPLYRADDLDRHPREKLVVVVEGEKAADALARAGILAVGTVTGAGGTPSAAVLGVLAGRNAALWADADPDGGGQAHLDRVGRLLQSQVKSLRWFTWDGAPPKGDAADYLAQHPDPDELRAALQAAPLWQPKDKPTDAAAPRSGRTLKIRTAKEIAQEVPERPTYIVEPWVVAGAITELDGRQKSSGKTTWVLAMCRAVLDGHDFMGQPTHKGPVLFLTEQPAASFRQSLQRAKLEGRDDFHIAFFQDTIGAKWEDVGKEVIEVAGQLGAVLLVVDTLGQFAHLPGDAENTSGAALEAIRPLQEAAGAGLGVLFTRHERKSGGEVGDSGRGSSAFSGAVDIILQMRRNAGNANSTQRVISALGRFETPDSLVIELQDGEYRAIGTQTQVLTEDTKTLLLDRLPSRAEEALTEADVIKVVKSAVGDNDQKGSRSTVKRALEDLLNEGKVRRLGAGVKGSAFKYWLAQPEFDSVQTPVVGQKQKWGAFDTVQTPLLERSPGTERPRCSVPGCNGTDVVYDRDEVRWCVDHFAQRGEEEQDLGGSPGILSAVEMKSGQKRNAIPIEVQPRAT